VDPTRDGAVSRRRRPRPEAWWGDLAAAFAGYLLGFLAAGLAVGGDQARAIGLGNVAGAATAALLVLARYLYRRTRRR
jgi:hypothetical protein